MKYQVAPGGITFASGVLLLTAAQAADRMQNLFSMGKGRYQVSKPVMFKAGEEIGIEGDLPKVMLDKLISLEAPKPAEASKPAKPKRADLDAALALLPGDYKDPEYVVTHMRSFFGRLFTEVDEAKVRELVIAPVVILGCPGLPELLDLGNDKTITGEELIKQTFEASKLELQAWNALSDDERKAKLQEFAEQLVAEGDKG